MTETYHLSQMGGIRRLALALALCATCIVVGTLGCNKPANTEGTTAAGGSSEEGPPKSNRPTRSEVACRLHSCSPPYYCNQNKGVCELLPCGASRDCPYGYSCDFSHHVCR